MWQIPTQERYGCGYVYSNKFITDEQAHKELEETTGRKIDKFRIIPFEPGRCERTWVGNVLAIGLSSHFLEPLEATSIHITCSTLEAFCSSCLHHTKEKTLTDFNINLFNKNFAETIDDYRDLIQMHYITKREDSEFWKYMKYELEISDRNKEVLNLCKMRVPSFKDFSDKTYLKIKNYDLDNSAGIIIPYFKSSNFICLHCNKIHDGKRSSKCCEMTNSPIKLNSAELYKLVIPSRYDVNSELLRAKNDFIDLHFPDLLSTILLK
jgi:hypothetical protein